MACVPNINDAQDSDVEGRVPSEKVVVARLMSRGFESGEKRNHEKVEGCDSVDTTKHKKVRGYDGLNTSDHENVKGYDSVNTSEHEKVKGCDNVDTNEHEEIGGCDSIDTSEHAHEVEPQRSSDGWTLYLMSDHTQGSEKDVMENFSKFGPIKHLSVKIDGCTGLLRSCVWFEYSTREQAEATHRALRENEIPGRTKRFTVLGPTNFVIPPFDQI